MKIILLFLTLVFSSLSYAGELHTAVMSNDIEKVYKLLESSVDANALDEKGNTPLQLAVENVHIDLYISKLLIKYSADVNAKNRIEETPLHEVAWANRLDMAHVLIENKADVNAVNIYGERPLHFSAGEDNLEMTQLLIENGADLNSKDKNGYTPLHFVVRNNCSHTAEILTKYDDVHLNSKNKEGRTPLHLAVTNPKMLKLLIESGADIDALDKQGNTPLHIATWTWELDSTYILIESGADVNARNATKNTPLHTALWVKDLEMAHVLIENGADVDAINLSGYTPLDYAKNSNIDTLTYRKWCQLSKISYWKKFSCTK